MIRACDEEDHPLCERAIEQRNEMLVRRYREFRRGANAVTAPWRAHPEVIALSLIGSVARAPWKEVPRASHRTGARGSRCGARARTWTSPEWLEHLDSLDALRRANARALRALWNEASIGIASHQVDVFILEPGTNRYLGRLCDFNACPKGKAQCGVPGCGDVALLRQHEGFRWQPESQAGGRAVRLFDRVTGLQRRAADLPLLEVDAG